MRSSTTRKTYLDRGYHIELIKLSGTNATLAAELIVQLCRNVDGVMSKILRTTLIAVTRIYDQ